MPRQSKVELTEETISELENQFYEFLSSLNSDETKKFFAEFLTKEEKMMMYKRLALFWSLLEGYTLAKIQQMIGVTHDTTRVYNKRKNELSPEFKALVGRIGRNQALESSQSIEHKEESSFDQPIEYKEPIQEAEQQSQMNNHTDSIEHQSEPITNEQNQEERAAEPEEYHAEIQHEEPMREEVTSQEADTTNNEGQKEEEPKKKSGFSKFFGF